MRCLSMRCLSISLVGLAALAAPALAETPQRVGCKSYAREVADQWSKGYIDVADEGETAAEDQVLIIAAGREYFVPRKMTGIVRPVYFRMRDRNQVFWDAFERCREGGNVTIILPPPQNKTN